MNPINASSLLHFTKTRKALEGILEKGFRFSYCCEEISSTINMNELYPNGASSFRPSSLINTHIAIPMICFCDIPLTRAKSHSLLYGKFIVGINKDIALTVYRDFLNPVMYRTSNEIDYALNALSVIKAHIQNIPEFYNYKRSLNQIIGNTKPYRGSFRKKQDHCFYDEREWRILMPDDYCDEANWHWNMSEDDFIRKKDEINNILYHSKCGYRGFTTDINEDEFIQFITHIVVNTERNVPRLVKFIMNEKQPLFGYQRVSQRTRELLVSKITSFERIEKDF